MTAWLIPSGWAVLFGIIREKLALGLILSGVGVLDAIEMC